MQRYEHYKNSGIEWLGEIPEHWEVKRLKNVIIDKLKYGANESGVRYSESLPRYIRITDFSNDGKLSENTKLSLPIEKAINYLLKDGDILFARSGATVGKSYKFSAKSISETCCFAGYLIKAESDQDKIIPDYLYAYTNSAVFDSWKSFIFNKATIENIGADKYSNLPIPLPPLAEQTAIANFLDRKCEQIDRAVAQKERVIELLNERRQTVIQRAVTRGLNPDVPLRDSGIDWIGEIPAHWEVVPIKRIVQVKDGTHDTPEYIYKSDITYPLITSKDFINDDIDFSDAKHISDTDYNKIIIRSNVEKLDVLMSMIGGNIGKSVIVNSDKKFAIKNVALFKTRSKRTLAKHIKYYLNSGLLDIQISLKSRGGAQDFLGLNDIRNLTFIKVSNNEIDYIINYLDTVNEKIDRAVALKREEVEKLKEYKQTLINSAVTGKIKIA